MPADFVGTRDHTQRALPLAASGRAPSRLRQSAGGFGNPGRVPITSRRRSRAMPADFVGTRDHTQRALPLAASGGAPSRLRQSAGGFGNPARAPITSRRRSRAMPGSARAREGLGTLRGFPLHLTSQAASASSTRPWHRILARPGRSVRAGTPMPDASARTRKAATRPRRIRSFLLDLANRESPLPRARRSSSSVAALR